MEWNIGEAAGALADWSLGRQRSPEQVWRDPGETSRFQRRLLEDGVPIAWIVDVPPGHPAFTAVQVLAAAGAPVAPERLELVPDAPLVGGRVARPGVESGSRRRRGKPERRGCSTSRTRRRADAGQGRRRQLLLPPVARRGPARRDAAAARVPARLARRRQRGAPARARLRPSADELPRRPGSVLAGRLSRRGRRRRARALVGRARRARVRRARRCARRASWPGSPRRRSSDSR